MFRNYVARLSAMGILGMVSTGAMAVQLAIPFEDHFDTATSIGGWDGGSLWQVQDAPAGSVDLIVSGAYTALCYGGTGGCVDLDGNTRRSGNFRLESTEYFQLTPGTTYRLSAQISGNQRGSENIDEVIANDSVTFGFFEVIANVFGPTGWTTTPVLANTRDAINPNNNFQYFYVDFTPPALAASNFYRIGFQNSGGDNYGAVLDNVRVAISPVPLPAAAWLLLSGLGALGLVSRRRRLVPAAA